MSKPVVVLSAIGPDGKTWSVPVCPKCRRTCIDTRHAEECCEPKICECGKPTGATYWIKCHGCRNAEHDKREAEKIEKASKVLAKDYNGPVFFNDEFYPSVDDLIDDFDYKEDPLPKLAWACSATKLSLDAEEIIGAELERQEHHEDAYDRLVDIDELQACLSEWCAKQDMETWFQRDDLLVDLSEYQK